MSHRLGRPDDGNSGVGQTGLGNWSEPATMPTFQKREKLQIPKRHRGGRYVTSGWVGTMPNRDGELAFLKVVNDESHILRKVGPKGTGAYAISEKAIDRLRDGQSSGDNLTAVLVWERHTNCVVEFSAAQWLGSQAGSVPDYYAEDDDPQVFMPRSVDESGVGPKHVWKEVRRDDFVVPRGEQPTDFEKASDL